MNEMIQEAVLDSIQAIDDAQLFTEFDVLLSMAEVYQKAIYIEESSNMTFDGYEVVQEEVVQEAKDEKGIKTVMSEKDGTYTSIGKPGKKYKIAGKKGFFNWLKGVFSTIGRALSTLWSKITGVFKTKALAVPTNYALSVIENGGEAKLNEEFAEKVGVSTDCFEKKNTEEIKKVQKATGDKIPVNAFTVFKVNIHYNPEAIKFGVKAMYEAVDHYKNAMEQDTLQAYQSIMSQVKPLREKAYNMLQKGYKAGEGYVSKHDYKQIMTDMINCEHTMKQCIKDCEDIKKVLNDPDFGPDSKRAFGISDIDVKNMQDDVKPMLATCQSLLSYASNLLKEVSPSQVKKRATKKLADQDYEDAEDNFIPKLPD